ncbi:hypothetical protein MMC25_004254 [Agyrium rufum]|nr:hypothetical protein [Agyrium rufum]
MSTRQPSRRKDAMRHSHPRPPLTPNNVGNTPTSSIMPQSIANPLLPSAPASPPTPAPSPTPHQRDTMWARNPEDFNEPMLRDFRYVFSNLSVSSKEAWMLALVDTFDNHMLNFVKHLVSPRLKKDPFTVLPNELCFKILEFVDDPKTLVRAAQVSRRWREILNDDQAWKAMCEKHAYRRMSSASTISLPGNGLQMPGGHFFIDPSAITSTSPESSSPITFSRTPIASSYTNLNPVAFLHAAEQHHRKHKRHRPKATHRSHFKHRFLVESAWRKGGQMTSRHITPDQGSSVVTSLHLTKKYIIVALDNAKIYVFNVRGEHLRTLEGHMMGVWAMVPWNDILVSGGCDRDVRVWNMNTGASIYTLRGHTSTVRCLKMSDQDTAISGSRDTMLRVWDIPSGTCKHTLSGHQASVRCLEIHGDYVVSGSYDTTARIWCISTGQHIRTLSGHFSQIYAIAFDGVRIATGSLDTSVRIWNPNDGICQAILQGHTSLVGQLQMRGTTLVSGGSDGSVRVWSLATNSPIHRLAAHDNSVTSLQFDDNRIVSGGSDGRVKIWDLKTGLLIRELSQPAEAVWRVAIEDERSVVLATRTGRLVMEVWNFAPPKDGGEAGQDRDGVDEMEGVEEGVVVPSEPPPAPILEGMHPLLGQQYQGRRGAVSDETENVDMVDAYAQIQPDSAGTGGGDGGGERETQAPDCPDVPS